nr:translocation/assembly module TamB domain-containing protein [Oceanococcus sp. HetDA_MAG_MS8]
MTRWFLYRFSPWLLGWFTLAVLIAGLLTETGFKLLWGQVRHVLPAGIHVDRVAGSLLVGPRIYGLDLQFGELRIQARSIEMDWSLLDQFGSHWQLRGIRLRELDLTLPSAQEQPVQDEQEEPATLQWPELPSLVIASMDLGQIRLWNHDQQIFQPLLQRLRARIEMQADQLAMDAALIHLSGQPPLQALLRSEWPEPTQGTAELRVDVLDAQGKQAIGQPLTSELQLNLAPHIQVQGQIRSAGLNVQPWLAQAEHPLVFAGGLAWDGSDATARLDQWELNTQWQNHPIAVTLPLLVWNGGVDLPERASLSVATAQVSAKGQLSQRSALHIEAHIPAELQILPGWRTPLELRAQVQGDMRKPWAVIHGHLQDWEGPDLRLASGDIAGRLSLDTSIANQAVVRLQQGELAGQTLDQLELTLRGSLERLQSQWQLQALGADIRGQAQARLATPGQRQASLDRLDIQLRPWEQWRLDTPLRWTEQGAAWRVAGGCLRSAESKLCLGAKQQGQVRNLELSLGDYSLQRLAQWAGQAPSLVDGRLSVEAKATQAADGSSSAQLNWTTGPVLLGEVPDTNIPGLRWAPGEGSLSWSPQQARMRWEWPLASADGGISAQAIVNNGNDIETAQLKLQLSDLGRLRGLLPEVQQLQGQLAVDIQAQGQLSSPTYEGQLQLQQASAQLITPGITLDPLELRLDGNQDQLRLQGQIGSGRGKMALTGSVQPLQQSASLRIRGQNFEVLRTDLGQVEISPELELDWQEELLNLSGQLRIPKANIHPASLPTAGPSFVAPSRDEVIVGEELTTRRSGIELAADIRLLVDSNARFEGFGLKTNLRGDLRIRQEPQREPTANGTLELIDGSYKAYGQDLTIQRGRLIFSGGGLDEPGIDLRAFRQPRSDIRVGIQARGAVRKPEISLWSEPGMNQTEQLSWLVLGRGSQNLNQAEESSMQNAALALGLKGSDLLSKRFKGKLGLDELSIGTRPGEDTSQAALVLGKYLNPRLYVSYGIGLFEPIYSFRARYEISSKWTLQTESGVESGGDLVYTIER